ncbi:hypothetical protein [Paraurantiacibacter namhicola]|uniref:Lipoprotein n=1 Tax=Paraurantiacibacter namhicola TaxID=645517 RepID=A0A1C7D8Z2_9SPHN|nr:hypothetical protein [Paraurantiacibacter namhicola]ANU07944.1 hypothetical protein A6F65_01646 [Paraurantiacibacter namhicola]
MRIAVVLFLSCLLLACTDQRDAMPDASSESADGSGGGNLALRGATNAVELQPILYPDIEANDLFGAGCNFASGKSMAAVVLAQSDYAAIKIDGEVLQLGPAEGTGELELGARDTYASEDYRLELALQGGGESSGYETVDFQGAVRLSDASGNPVYATTGTAQCGS